MQQFLKSATREAWAWIIAAKLLTKLLVAANDARAALDTFLGGKALPAFANDLESSCRGACSWIAWDTSALNPGIPGGASYGTTYPMAMRQNAPSNVQVERPRYAAIFLALYRSRPAPTYS